MSDMQYKRVSISKFGWKRVAKNFMRFGWDLDDATQVTTTTTNTEYEGRVVGDKVHITPHTTSSSKVHMELEFSRDRSEYSNLLAIFPLELVYNIVFLIRRLIGAILAIATPIFFVVMIFGGFMMEGETQETLMLAYMIPIFVWIVGMIIESLLAFIASKILRYEE